MKFLFIVQGEGRGHTSEALAMYELLTAQGHEVTKVLTGHSNQRTFPLFFFENTNISWDSYESPNFFLDTEKRKINLLKTFAINLYHWRRYFRSTKFIKKTINKENPDWVINFYEPLCGLCYMLFRPKAKYLVIGHHLLLKHPEFKFPEGYKLQRRLLAINTFITTYKATYLMALSFHEMQDIPDKKLYIMPPLLRKEIKSVKIKDEKFILIYLLHSAYFRDIEKWHQTNSSQVLHIFMDDLSLAEKCKTTKNIYIHPLDNSLFIEYLAKCQGVITTAGFETVCEAMCLNKSVLMVPSENNFEQTCNAYDAIRVGAGIMSSTFNPEKLLKYLVEKRKNEKNFNLWCDSFYEKFNNRIRDISNFESYT
jgi:uncharacterized protein (TIGR00661 family)